MKKTIALLLLAAMLLSLLAACGKTESPAQTPDPVPGDTAETPEAPVTPEEPEVIELVEPNWVEPVYDMEETLELRQQALSATAAAYYYKGLLNQYGLQDLNVIDEFSGGGLRGKTLERNSPEENTEDQTLYQWCSSYVYDIVYQTMGYKINGDYRDCRTANLSRGSITDRATLLVYQYEYTGKADADKAVVDEIVSNLQPGDIVTYSIPDGNGHSLMVVNDMTGDDIMDVLHRTGSRYDMTTGQEKTETYGIKREHLSTFQGGSQTLYDRVRMSVIRATNLDATAYPLTTAAKARVAWPGLRIDRTVEGGIFGSVVSGGELTYTIEIYNYGTEPIQGLPVMDKLDSHCTMVSQDGKPATTTYPVWSVDIAPNSSVTLTYTVKVEGAPGEQIVSMGGSVAGIPSNQLVTTIQAYTPDSAKLQSEAAAAAAAATGGLDFVNKLYEAATGVNPGILPMEELRSTIFDTQMRSTIPLYYVKEDLSSQLGRSLIPTYVGGRNVITPDNERVLEIRLEDLHPGDILVADGIKQNKPITYYWIYNGDKLVEWSGGKAKNVTNSTIEKLLSFPFFVALRPSLAQ